MHLPQYDHTQRGKLHYVLHITALAVAAICLIRIPGAGARIMICCVIGTTAVREFFAFTCITLRVYDDQDCLKLEFGPLPLLKKPYRLRGNRRYQARSQQDYRWLGDPLHTRSGLDLQRVGIRLC